MRIFPDHFGFEESENYDKIKVGRTHFENLKRQGDPLRSHEIHEFLTARGAGNYYWSTTKIKSDPDWHDVFVWLPRSNKDLGMLTKLTWCDQIF